MYHVKVPRLDVDKLKKKNVILERNPEMYSEVY